jgi:putative FmdB family regulatory protein
MPTYEYLCSACANEWEEIQKISESPLDTCPKCAQKTAKRQISAGNFILKGGGWYADLYSSTGNKKSGDTSGDAKPDAPKTAEAKSDGASAGKAESAPTPSAKSDPAAPAPKAPSTTPSKT